MLPVSGVNMTLKRKPPPPLDGLPPQLVPSHIPEEPDLPLLPTLMSERYSSSFQYPRTSEKKHPHILLSMDANLSYESAYDNENNEYADFADYAEDLLLSYESPRLKGPQILTLGEISLDFLSAVNLPLKSHMNTTSEPSSPASFLKPQMPISPLGSGPSAKIDNQKLNSTSSNLPNRNSLYRQRKFQNLLQRGTSPLRILESDEDEPLDFFERNPAQLHTAEVHTPLPKSLPYPVSDEYYSDEGSENFDANNTFEGIQERRKARITPTRIPSLVAKDSMKVLDSPFSLSKASPPDFHFLRNSPPRISNLLSTLPDLQLRNYNSSPLSSSPRASWYSRLPQNYSRIVNDSRSSRSPSPKKHNDKALPKPALYPYEEDYLDVFADHYNQERVPRWSLIENDGFDHYDDSFIAPPAASQFELFDYTILPELPKWTDDLSSQSIYTPPLKSTLTMRRKNDDLPPVPLDLPLLPFLPAALSALHFAACANVWSLNSVFQWCLQLDGWTHGQNLSLKEFKKVLMRLIAFHKQDVPIDLISRNVNQIIDSFTKKSLLIFEPISNLDEKQKTRHFRFSQDGDIGGVLVDLTACYCVDEDHELTGRRNFTLKCYSSLCLINKTIEHENQMRTTNITELVLGSDWASHWKLAAQDMNIDLSESKKQSFLFDLIKFEQTFIQRAECFVEIAGPEFIKLAKLMMGTNSPSSMKDFEEKVLLSAKELLSIHRVSLFEPLLRILVADGKFIKDVSGMVDLYKAWALEAKAPLLSYISGMPMIEDLLSNVRLKKWDEHIRSNSRMKELQVNGNLLLMSTFNSRYQQLPLQLLDIRKFFDEDDDEYSSLSHAIDAIRQLGSKVNEMKVFSDNVHALRLVEKQLSWKSNISQPRLNLRSSRRKFFYRGDLARKGDLKINSHSAHVIVLDNYLLITEKQRAQKLNAYKVTETPIPLDYLIVENREKETHSLSLKSAYTQVLSNTANGADEESSSYPFKIRYAGRGKGENHTLIAATEKERTRWILVIVQARANILKRVLSVTPYNFALIENSFFSYEPGLRMIKLPIMCSADPISQLAKDASTVKSESARKALVHRNIQCSENFIFAGENFTLLGTSAGVYCSDMINTWKKIVNMNNVSKVTVISELNIVLILANKTLRFYPLRLLVDVYYEKTDKVTSFQLSNEGILFFEYGCHRGLPMLFVAKKKNAGTTSFKVYVLEVDNNGIFSTFTVLERFYIPNECHGMAVFNSSIAIFTQKGFEVLDLQKLSPRSIPELPTSDSSPSKKLDGYSRKKVLPSTDVLRRMISHATPMGMFKLSNNKEFLMVYNECAIFVNKSGKLSRSLTLRFDFRPKNIAFVDNNLFLVCDEVIEIWSISSSTNGTNKLSQVIPSKDLHILDAQKLFFKLANPDSPDLQIVFQMTAKPEPVLAPG